MFVPTMVVIAVVLQLMPPHKGGITVFIHFNLNKL